MLSSKVELIVLQAGIEERCQSAVIVEVDFTCLKTCLSFPLCSDQSIITTPLHLII